MKVSLARPDELGPSERSAWRAIQRANPEFDNAFLSPGFAIAAGRVRPAARVAVIEDGNVAAGFFAFEQGRFRVGRPIAAGISDAQALVRAPGADWNAHDLLRSCRLDVWEFDHLIAPSWALAGRNLVPRVSSVIDVSEGYDAYLADRLVASKKILRSTLAKERKLRRAVDDDVRFDFDSRDREALRLLERWKSAQYRRTGRRDRFAVGWIEQLVGDLFDEPGDGCTGTLSVLYAASGVVAAHFGLRSDATLSCWFPAYDIGLGRYSPGLVLHLKMAEQAAAARIRYLDLGKGDDDYKISLKNKEHLVGEGWIDCPSTAAVVRRAQRSPRRWAYRLLDRQPALRRMARRVLKHVGGMRGGKAG
jgi:CelD/BcsL family acetyltransferase involved in cellulose biosynthesis